MTNKEIFAKISNILTAYIPEASNDKLTESTNIVDDLGINSSRLVDIVLDFEDKFGIRIEDSEIDKMPTIGDAVNLVAALLSGTHDAVVEKAGAD